MLDANYPVMCYDESAVRCSTAPDTSRLFLLLLFVTLRALPAIAQQPLQLVRDNPSPFPHLADRPGLPGKALAAANEKTVRFIYLVPADSAIKPEYTLAIKNAAHHLQQWYRDQLGDGLSFRLTDDVVDVYHSTHPSDWYTTSADAAWAGEWRFWFNAVNDAFALSGGRFEDPDNFWIIYIDALSTCDQKQGGGLNGVAAMGVNDLRGLVGLPFISLCNEVIPDYSPCRYVGGLGHELGHAFGLPHPPGCDDGQTTCDYNALMYTGYITYPATHFSESEKATMRSSPFITTIPASNCKIDCSSLDRDYAVSSSQNVFICPGEGYFAGGKLQTSAGTYVDWLRSKDGCDSVVTTTLRVLPSYDDIHRDVFICSGESLFAGGKLQTSTGVYVDHLISKAGCDSTVTTHLTVSPKYNISKVVSICEGESLLVGGKLQTKTGQYIDTFKSKSGCDSTVTTNLQVQPAYRISKDANICAGESYLVGGVPRTTTGTYTEVFVSRFGCDSTIVVCLTVWEKYSMPREVTICEGDTFFAGGKFQSTPGVYIDEFKSKGGCDSTVVTTLKVNAIKRVEQTITICSGAKYFAGGGWKNASGTYEDIYKTLHGCDSVVVTSLCVVDQIEVSREISICSGESFSTALATYATSGSYRELYVSRAGCDSVVTLNICVLPPLEHTIEINTCDGEPYFAEGQWQYEPGNYRDVLKSKHGCDSVLITKLIVGVCTAVAEVEDPTISVYPVPAQSTIYIHAPLFDHANLMNQAGQLMITSSTRELNVGDVSNGVYYLRIYEDPKSYVIRRIVLLR